MAGRNFHFGNAGDAPQTKGMGIFTGLTKKGSMSLTPHLVEYHSSYMNFCAKGFESVDDGCCTICHAAGINDDNDGDAENVGNFCRTTVVTVVSIKKPHHSFHHVDIL